MKRKLLIFLVVSWQAVFAGAQDLSYVHACIDSLASPGFQGRGYVAHGDGIAAGFLLRQLKDIGVKPWGESYYQYFTLNINTFAGKMDLSVDETPLTPGRDFLVALSSPGIRGTFKTIWFNGNSLKKEADVRDFKKKDPGKFVLILDTSFHDLSNPVIYQAKAVLKTTTKGLTWDVSDGAEVSNCAVIDVLRDKIPENCSKVTFNIENAYQKDYRTQNVAGYIPGTLYPDSFFVFIGHYDHLGRMGAATYFPGAHDNASGCAMLLDLAKFYSLPENRQPFSVAFIFLSGEEAGLLGSHYYTGHPLFPFRDIKFLLNLDMESTGSEGIKVVNGSVFKKEFNELVALNKENQYLKTISPRGEAANSDHYWFYKNGVKCFYIYTLGNEWKEYHTITDVASGLPMTKYNELFKLITKFVALFTQTTSTKIIK
jgi:aminopeptidase YwaD